nr:MAG TPA: hypothetical protein [Caudoviricetes sp.]
MPPGGEKVFRQFTVPRLSFFCKNFVLQSYQIKPFVR